MWGSADTGGPWTVGGNAAFSVAPGTASSNVPKAGATITANLLTKTSSSTDLTMTVATDKIANNNGTYFTFVGRRVGTNLEYEGRARITGTGSVVAAIGALTGTSTGVTFGSQIVVPGLTLAAGTPMTARLQVVGTAPTTIRFKIWATSGSEPASWQLTSTDATPALQSPGSVGLTVYVSTGSTNAPVVVRVTDLSARPAAG